MEGIVIDTNVFVAAGFNPRSTSACVLAAVRDGRFRLIWNQATRREIEMILRRIRRLDWEKVANLFQPEGEFTGPVDPSAFVLVRDRDDRKFAALSAAAKGPLITNDNYLLTDLSIIGIDALTPRAFLARAGGPHLEAGGAIENAQASRRTKAHAPPNCAMAPATRSAR